ncbi:MAG: HAMP domain-containing sensor histidine kinase [Anaerolineae bacterium]
MPPMTHHRAASAYSKGILTRHHFMHVFGDSHRRLLRRIQRLRVAYARQALVNRELRDFNRMLAHDLINSIGNMRMVIEMLQLQDSGETDLLAMPIDSVINIMNNSLDQVDRLIQNMQTTTRENQRVLKKLPLNLESLVEGVLHQFQAVIDAQQVTVTLDSLPTVYADRLALEQIMINLISNAIKFRHHGRRCEIVISATVATDFTYIYVTDNGRGIPRSAEKRVFGKLSRPALPNEIPGEELGLSYVRNLVMRHSGAITYESTPGEGTRFILVLPNPPAPLPRAPSQVAHPG